MLQLHGLGGRGRGNPRSTSYYVTLLKATFCYIHMYRSYIPYVLPQRLSIATCYVPYVISQACRSRSLSIDQYVCNYDDIDQGGGAFWRSGLQRLGLHNSQVLLLLLRRLGSRRRRWHKDFDGTTSGTVAEKLKWLPLLRD